MRLVEQVTAGACASNCTKTGAPRRRPSTTASSVADDHGHPGDDPYRHAERERLRREHRSPPSRAARSMRFIPRAPAAGTRPTSSSCLRPEANVLPSSTNPTRPFTVNTVDEHLDMLMVCHHLDPKSIPEDVAFAESRIRQGDDRGRGYPARHRRVLALSPPTARRWAASAR